MPTNITTSPRGKSSAAVTAAAVTATLTGVDTGTDMTAAQAATIVTDLTNLAARVNSIITALEVAKIVAPN